MTTQFAKAAKQKIKMRLPKPDVEAELKDYERGYVYIVQFYRPSVIVAKCRMDDLYDGDGNRLEWDI